jgi:hypothetical protein
MGARRVLISLLSHFAPPGAGAYGPRLWITAGGDQAGIEGGAPAPLSRTCRAVRGPREPTGHHASSSVRQVR